MHVKIRLLQQWRMGWETAADKSNLLRKVNEQSLRISTTFKSTTSFKVLASTPYKPRITFCITIANKMVDDLKGCLKEIQHILDSFDLNNVYVFLNIVYSNKVL